MSATVLIVDDEPDLLGPLEFAFRREGFAVRTAATGAAALAEARRGPRPDIVLLDRMLPDIQGTEVFRALRADPATAAMPIVMLTALGDEVDRVVGFELGVDDYVVKPFSTRELVLRVRAVLRRVEGAQAHAESTRIGPLVVDRAARRTWVDEVEVDLSPQELRLLLTLIDRQGRACSREALVDEVWELGAAVEARTVDTVVKRLRRRLGAAGDLIETVRGHGYRLSRPAGGA
jgi:two-component system, OmpR family, phosphate regulon response regulator PhoB